MKRFRTDCSSQDFDPAGACGTAAGATPETGWATVEFMVEPRVEPRVESRVESIADIACVSPDALSNAPDW